MHTTYSARAASVKESARCGQVQPKYVLVQRDVGVCKYTSVRPAGVRLKIRRALLEIESLEALKKSRTAPDSQVGRSEECEPIWQSCEARAELNRIGKIHAR